eukprot:jgi/Ulvmu1/6858/UM031_0063.1
MIFRHGHPLIRGCVDVRVRNARSSSSKSVLSNPDKRLHAKLTSIDYQDLQGDVAATERIREALTQAFVLDDALGVIAVDSVPGLSHSRSTLLPMAAQLAQLDTTQQEAIERPDTRYNVGWSRGRERLNGGEPDWNKGSFYANPLCDEPSSAVWRDAQRRSNQTLMPANVWPSNSLPDLEPAFKALGRTMCEIATLLLQHCDCLIQQQQASSALSVAQISSQAISSATSELQSSPCSNHGHHPQLARLSTPLQHQVSNKGRLLHYYSVAPGDNGMWCGWHNDFGTLTGLTSAMYLPCGSTSAADELPNPDPCAGLVVRSRAGAAMAVRSRPDQLLFQAGLSLQILSGGLFKATEHAVLAPQHAQHGLTRSTFAVFCQPKFAPDAVRPVCSHVIRLACGL